MKLKLLVSLDKLWLEVSELIDLPDMLQIALFLDKPTNTKDKNSKIDTNQLRSVEKKDLV